MNTNLIASTFIVIVFAITYAILPDSISKGYFFIGLIIGILALLIGAAFYRQVTRRKGHRGDR